MRRGTTKAPLWKRARSVAEHCYVRLETLFVSNYNYCDEILARENNKGALLHSGILSQNEIDKLNREYNITFVASIVEEHEKELLRAGKWDQNIVKQKNLPISDHELKIDEMDQAAFHNEIYTIISEMHATRSAGKDVLIHCRAGKGRSFFVEICYLVMFEGMSISQARHYVAQRRPQVSRTEEIPVAVFNFLEWAALNTTNFNHLAFAKETIGEELFGIYGSIYAWNNNLVRIYNLTEHLKDMLENSAAESTIESIISGNKIELDSFTKILNELAIELGSEFDAKQNFSCGDAEMFYQSTLVMLELRKKIIDSDETKKATLKVADEKLHSILTDSRFKIIQVQADAKELEHITATAIEVIESYRKTKKPTPAGEPEHYWETITGTWKQTLSERHNETQVVQREIEADPNGQDYKTRIGKIAKDSATNLADIERPMTAAAANNPMHASFLAQIRNLFNQIKGLLNHFKDEHKSQMKSFLKNRFMLFSKAKEKENEFIEAQKESVAPAA